ncbi:hypothetical protein DL96DRAFT_1456806, partial [Flagelloscypha sp. PMI_526]
ASGVLKDEFHLKVTLLGAEFDQKIRPKKYPSTASATIKKWFSAATVSGYGDVRALETKIDETVRAAREISAEHIQLEDSLLRIVERTWSDNHFIPSQVRGQLYKMHLYGPRGHFQSHKDTPERDLVGTFLLGLGEDSYHGNFKIGEKRFTAAEGHWVAFHPDVPHSVIPLGRDEYRATLAFKLFRTPESTPDSEVAHSRSSTLLTALEMVPTPYGLILSREYCLGTEEFGAFDAALMGAIKTSTKLEHRVIPILTQFGASWYDPEAGDRTPDEDEKFSFDSNCKIFPLTKADVDLFYGRNKAESKKATAWYRNLRKVPFYLVDNLEKSSFTWKKDKNEDFLGNDTRAEREDSLYLSYALIVQAKPRDQA